MLVTRIQGCILLWLLPLFAMAQAVDSGHVKAELIAEEAAWQAGGEYWIGLRLDMQEGWHTYWRNPGDSGAPTTLAWTLPDGVSVSAIEWPVPERIPYGPLVNLGYHGSMLLPMRVTLPPSYAQDSVTLAAEGEWLVCADICVPESASLSLVVPLGRAETAAANAAAFAHARQQLPQDIGVAANHGHTGDELVLRVTMASLKADKIDSIMFLPYQQDAIALAEPQLLSFSDGGFELQMQPGYDYDPSHVLSGLVVVEEAGGLQSVFEVNANSGVSGGAAAISLGAALLLAFLGGLILNLMPCVFPVLSIKVLSLVEGTHGDHRLMHRHGYSYTLGVVLSFVAIALTLILLRAGGAQIGWGFQLQAPWVVLALFYLFVVIGLSLSGYVEFGGRLMNLGGTLTAGSGYSGSFFTGVLAAVVAAPCTAPFMGAAIGFAMTQPALVALSVFAALGLGMAAPYLLLCFWPALLARMPRPGAWMETLKEILAFPMYASALWLLWVLNQQTGADGLLLAGSGLLLIVFALWCWRHGSLAASIAGVAALLAAAVVSSAVAREQTVASVGGEANVAEQGAGPLALPYSSAQLAEQLELGPVFVNFTAAWCITCKVNDVAVLDTQAVRTLFSDNDITYLKGDWTNEDPVITQALAEYGRNGVPLYLFYRKPGERATVLPQILTHDIIASTVRGSGQE